MKIFRSDGGTKSLDRFYYITGIIPQLSCRVSERKHRHITETGLTMMFHSKVPQRLWAEAFSTAVYIIYSLPVGGHISFQLFKTHPDYSSLRVLGCTCYPHATAMASNKFSPKTVECVFLGPITKAIGAFTYVEAICFPTCSL